MPEWMTENATLLWWLTAFSAVTFVGSLLLVPAVVVRIPPDYFAGRERKPSAWAGRHPVVRGLIFVARNLAGPLLILAGIAMLVLPGQGVLTIVFGLVVMEFPGKYRLELWMISRRRVLGAINWLRRIRGREPLQVWGVGGVGATK